MATSLQSQLQALQHRPDHDNQLRHSFLFNDSDAKQISREEVHQLAMAGLRTLVAIDNRMDPFVDKLFDESVVRRERSMFTTGEAEEFGKDLTHFLTLLGPHLLLTAAHQVIEFLCRVYEVHTFHTLSVIEAFLPFHDHPLFARILAMLDLRKTGFEFLQKNQKQGGVLPRRVLITACAENKNVLGSVCNAVTNAIRYNVSNNAAFALFIGVGTGLAHHAEAESAFRVLLPSIVDLVSLPLAPPAGLPISVQKHALSAALIVLCTWASEVELNTKALTAAVKPLIALLAELPTDDVAAAAASGLPQDNNDMAEEAAGNKVLSAAATSLTSIVSVADMVTALGHIIGSQPQAREDPAFTGTLRLLIELPWATWQQQAPIVNDDGSTSLRVLPTPSETARGKRLHPLLSAMLRAAVTAAPQHEASRKFLDTIIQHFSFFTKEDILTVVTMIVALCADDSKSKQKANVHEDLVALLRVVERHYSLTFDHAVAQLMDDTTAAHNEEVADVEGEDASTLPAPEKVQSFIASHVAGAKYLLVETNGVDKKKGAADQLPLVSCLMHHLPQIRTHGLKFLTKTATTTKSGSPFVDERTKVASTLVDLFCHVASTECDPAAAMQCVQVAATHLPALIATDTLFLTLDEIPRVVHSVLEALVAAISTSGSSDDAIVPAVIDVIAKVNQAVKKSAKAKELDTVKSSAAFFFATIASLVENAASDVSKAVVKEAPEILSAGKKAVSSAANVLDAIAVDPAVAASIATVGVNVLDDRLALCSSAAKEASSVASRLHQGAVSTTVFAALIAASENTKLIVAAERSVQQHVGNVRRHAIEELEAQRQKKDGGSRASNNAEAHQIALRDIGVVATKNAIQKALSVALGQEKDSSVDGLTVAVRLACLAGASLPMPTTQLAVRVYWNVVESRHLAHSKYEDAESNEDLSGATAMSANAFETIQLQKEFETISALLLSVTTEQTSAKLVTGEALNALIALVFTLPLYGPTHLVRTKALQPIIQLLNKEDQAASGAKSAAPTGSKFAKRKKADDSSDDSDDESAKKASAAATANKAASVGASILSTLFSTAGANKDGSLSFLRVVRAVVQGETIGKEKLLSVAALQMVLSTWFSANTTIPARAQAKILSSLVVPFAPSASNSAVATALAGSTVVSIAEGLLDSVVKQEKDAAELKGKKNKKKADATPTLSVGQYEFLVAVLDLVAVAGTNSAGGAADGTSCIGQYLNGKSKAASPSKKAGSGNNAELNKAWSLASKALTAGFASASQPLYHPILDALANPTTVAVLDAIPQTDLAELLEDIVLPMAKLHERGATDIADFYMSRVAGFSTAAFAATVGIFARYVQEDGNGATKDAASPGSKRGRNDDNSELPNKRGRKSGTAAEASQPINATLLLQLLELLTDVLNVLKRGDDAVDAETAAADAANVQNILDARRKKKGNFATIAPVAVDVSLDTLHMLNESCASLLTARLDAATVGSVATSTGGYSTIHRAVMAMGHVTTLVPTAALTAPNDDSKAPSENPVLDALERVQAAAGLSLFTHLIEKFCLPEMVLASASDSAAAATAVPPTVIFVAIVNAIEQAVTNTVEYCGLESIKKSLRQGLKLIGHLLTSNVGNLVADKSVNPNTVIVGTAGVGNKKTGVTHIAGVSIVDAVRRLLVTFMPLLQGGSDSSVISRRDMIHIPILAMLIRLDGIEHEQQSAQQEEGDDEDVAKKSANQHRTADEIVSEILFGVAGDADKNEKSAALLVSTLTDLLQCVLDPETHLQELSASLTGGDYDNDQQGMLDMFKSVLKTGKVLNRQLQVITFATETLKDPRFLGGFVAMQAKQAKKAKNEAMAAEAKRKKKAADGEDDVTADVEGDATTAVDGDYSDHCAKLLVAILNTFAHFHQQKKQVLPDSAMTLETVETEQQEEAILLELVSGNALACILSAINEQTFATCVSKLLKYPIDLATVDETAENASGLNKQQIRLLKKLQVKETATKKSSSDVRVKESAAANNELLGAFSDETRASIQEKALQLLLDRLQRSCPTADDEFAELAAQERHAAQKISEDVDTNPHRLRNRTRAIRAGGTAALRMLRPSTTRTTAMLLLPPLLTIMKMEAANMSKNNATKLQLSIVCAEEIVRTVGTRQTTSAAQRVAFAKMKQFGLVPESDTIEAQASEELGALTALTMGRRAQVLQLHSIFATLVKLIRHMLPTVEKQTSNATLSAHSYVLVGAALTAIATMSTTLGSRFMLESNNELSTTESTGEREHHSMGALDVLNRALHAGTASLSAKNIGHLRRCAITSLRNVLPQVWSLCQPLLPSLFRSITHNYYSGSQAALAAEDDSAAIADILPPVKSIAKDVLEDLAALLEPRVTVECVCESITSTFNSAKKGAIADSGVADRLTISTRTHSMVTLYGYLQKLLSKLTSKSLSKHFPKLLTDRGDFWVSSLQVLTVGGETNNTTNDDVQAVFDCFFELLVKFKEDKARGLVAALIAALSANRPSVAAEKANEKRQAVYSDDDDQEDAIIDLAGSEDDDDELPRKKKAGGKTPAKKSAVAKETKTTTTADIRNWTIAVQLCDHCVSKLAVLSTFLFPVITPLFVDILAAYGGGALKHSGTGGSAQDEFRNMSAVEKSLVTKMLTHTLTLVASMGKAATEDAEASIADALPTTAYFADVPVFTATMTVVVRQLHNTQLLADGSLSYLERAEITLIPALRAYFKSLMSPKMWSKTQEEILRGLRSSSSSVRRVTLATLRAIYADGGDQLAALIMAEALPAIVESTEDSNDDVVEEARLLCNELSEISGQDVLHAMA